MTTGWAGTAVMGDDAMTRIQQFLQQNAGYIGAGALTLAGAAAASIYLTSGPEPVDPPLDLNNQSIVVDEKVKPTASHFFLFTPSPTPLRSSRSAPGSQQSVYYCGQNVRPTASLFHPPQVCFIPLFLPPP